MAAQQSSIQLFALTEAGKVVPLTGLSQALDTLVVTAENWAAGRFARNREQLLTEAVSNVVCETVRVPS